MKIERSPFKNVYWFARYLLDTDQYGGLGRSKEMAMLKTVSLVETILANLGIDDNEKFRIAKSTILDEIMHLTTPNTKVYAKYKNFCRCLEAEIKNLNDVIAFEITMKYIVAPINRALAMIPSSDYEFSAKAAKSILDFYGREKAGLVISVWDRLGVHGCINVERVAIVEAFNQLLDSIAGLRIAHDTVDDSIMLTAFVQEFERRAGQKRKSRGGQSLESVTSFLFEYFNIKSSTRPAHFDQDIEVDKWFRCKDGWSIGISCKRTLRERWKQLSQADRGTLSHFKIKEIWHLITFDSDLSDDKIVRLGEQRQIFYLLDDSPTYIRCASHAGMQAYVRPLSRLIDDIKSNQ